MQVNRTGVSQGVGTTRSGGGASGASGVRFELPGAAPTQRPQAAAAIASTPALLFVQEVDDPPRERRRKAMRRAADLLDGLSELQACLLDDKPDPGRILSLLQTLRRDADASGDPALDTAIRDVETRAAVEIAKLGLDPFGAG